MSMSWEGLKRFGLPKREQARPGEEGPATKCLMCKEILFKKTLHDNLGICPHCEYYHRLSARRRMEITLDEGSFQERYSNLISKDPLSFQGAKSYASKLKESWQKTGEASAMLVGTGRIMNHPVAFGASDSFFIQGSMGSVLGEKFTRITEDAIKERLPLIVVSGTGGGARMYEGIFSLMQMAKTSAALGRLHDAGLPYISICTDCTMAGVWASWAALGDIIIAEPKALIGFTGPRVIQETIKKELPEGFQSSEFLLKCGQVDMIVERKAMRDRMNQILTYLCGPAGITGSTSSS